MDHELKIWPQYYQAVASGAKTFEVRENDRGFQTGDTVTLKEWDPKPKNPTDSKIPIGYTGAPDLHFTIGYIFILTKDKVIFSLLPPPKPQKELKSPSKKAQKS